MRLRGVCVEQVSNPVGTWCTCNKSRYGELFAASLTLQCIWAALMHKCSLLQSFWTSLSNDTPTRQILFVGCYSDRLHINTVGVAGNKLECIKPICFISFVVFIIALICSIILHLNNIKLNQMHPNVTENVRLIKNTSHNSFTPLHRDCLLPDLSLFELKTTCASTAMVFRYSRTVKMSCVPRKWYKFRMCMKWKQ